MLEYLTDNLWLVWTLICVLALILEVSSGTFYLLCFAIGAAVTIPVSLTALPLWGQVLMFLVVSVASVYGVRPFVMKYLHRNDDGRVSNADALIGRVGRVIEPISPSTPGYVRVDGDEWKAVAQDEETIPNGTTVRVVARESIIVTVERI